MSLFPYNPSDYPLSLTEILELKIPSVLQGVLNHHFIQEAFPDTLWTKIITLFEL